VVASYRLNFPTYLHSPEIVALRMLIQDFRQPTPSPGGNITDEIQYPLYGLPETYETLLSCTLLIVDALVDYAIESTTLLVASRAYH